MPVAIKAAVFEVSEIKVFLGYLFVYIGDNI